MERIPIPQFNQQADDVLARVEHGETVEITKEGRLVARVMPAGTRVVPTGSGEMDDWIADGRAVPATVHGPIPMPTIKAPPGEDAAELIRQLRDEEYS